MWGVNPFILKGSSRFCGEGTRVGMRIISFSTFYIVNNRKSNSNRIKLQGNLLTLISGMSRDNKVGLTLQLTDVTKGTTVSNFAFYYVSTTSWLQDDCQQLLGPYTSLSIYTKKMRK